MSAPNPYMADDREAQEVEALIEVLSSADPNPKWAPEQARAILASDWLAARDAQRDRAAGEKALRDAADEFERVETPQGTFFKAQVLRVLRDRADRLGSEGVMTEPTSGE